MSATTETDKPATVEADNLVSIDLASIVFGTTRKAIEQKIAKGTWVAGRQYHRSPDGRIWIDRKGVRQWVVNGKA